MSDDSEEDQQVDIDKIGTKSPWKKERERTFLQKRKDAKQNFFDRMAKYKEQDMEKKLAREGRTLEEMTFQEKASL